MNYSKLIKNRLNQTSLLFCIDVRALAVFRILIGCSAIISLVPLFLHADRFYSNTGVLPDTLPVLRSTSPVIYYLPGVPGSDAIWVAMFVISLLAAIVYTVGFHARFAAIILWFGLLVLHARNPFVIHSGHFLLRYAVLFSMFMPLSARYSLHQLYDSDVVRGEQTIMTVGTVGILLQIFIMYTANLFYKLSGET